MPEVQNNFPFSTKMSDRYFDIIDRGRDIISTYLTFARNWRIKFAFGVDIYNYILRIPKIMSALRRAFEGTKGKIAAGGLAAMMTLVSLGSATQAQDLASNTANATNASVTTTTAAPQGRPVMLRVGLGFDVYAAGGVADALNAAGCPTTVTTELGFPKRLTVEVEDKKFKFTSSGSAGASALDWCLEKS
jgi:hypothetical protein